MCNLYALTKSQDAIRVLLRAVRDALGNLPTLSAIYPDQSAPILRLAPDGGRHLVRARWGMPSPAFALRGKQTDRGLTNIRNTTSPHWRPYLTPGHRCLVPFDAFAEPAGAGTVAWFTLGPERPLACFAGVWTHWSGTRRLKEGPVSTDLFGFLTTSANAEVARIHPKAMPVILTGEKEYADWLTLPWAEACRMQRPLADGTLHGTVSRTGTSA